MTLDTCDTRSDDSVINSTEPERHPQTFTNLKIGTLNVCGLKTRINYPEFTSLIHEYDIVCVSETKLDQYDIIECPNYKFLSKPRNEAYKRKSGGIGFFVNKSLMDRAVTLESACEYIYWLKITDPNHDEIVIGAIYIPPETSRFFNNDEFFQMETDINDKCTTFKNVIITGDANGYTSNLPDYTEPDDFINEYFEIDNENTLEPTSILRDLNLPLTRASQCTKTNGTGTKLLNICKQNNLLILNGRCANDRNIGMFTFKSISVIDYTLCSTNLLEYVCDFKVIEIDPLFCDGHCMLLLELKHLSASNHPDYSSIANAQARRPPKWKEEQKDEFCHNIDPESLTEIHSLLDVAPPDIKMHLNKVTDKISNLFINSANKTFPARKTYGKQLPKRDQNYEKGKPWFGPHCKKARNAYHYARKAFQLHKCMVNKTRLNKASVHYKKTMNTYMAKHKYTVEKKLRTMSTNKPKDYWKFINSLNKNNNCKSPTMEAFFDHFKNINQVTHQDNPPDLDNEFVPNQETLDLLNSPITHTEIDKAISKSKNGKSPSQQDYILNEYIKSTKSDLTPIYSKLFNKILDTGTMPDAWLVGTIKPIYKNKGSQLDPGNYRPITILSCMGKLFTAIINTRINNFLNDNNLLCENQAGFRSDYSTCDHIFTLNFLVQKLKSEKKKLYCSFIDFSAAFDSVWRAGLWYKLSKGGIKGKVFDIIKNMYSDIKSCVANEGNVSSMFSSSCGVRQGENLSPILFSLYLNDLESYLTETSNGIPLNINTGTTMNFLKLLILLYADDTIIFSESNTELQTCLNRFDAYCKEWKLNVNYSKTKVVVFGSRKIGALAFHINENPIEIVGEYKYLGVLFKSTGSFIQCRKHLITQANKALFQLYVKINNLSLPIDLQIKLFDHTILPILTYGCEIWGYENIDMIEEFHCNFLRRITKAKKSTPRYMLYAELSRQPIDIQIKSRMIKFWVSIVQAKQSKISSQIYRYMIQQNINNKWITHIKTILNHTGFYNLWINQTTITGKSTHKFIKHRLIDQFKQEWHAKLGNSSKGTTYLSFKDNIDFETYLTILPQSLRLSMFHYRTGNHRLPIETGRWRQSFVPHESRKCTLCTTNDIGDEMHYLLICPFFERNRHKYIPVKYSTRPNMLKFNDLMNSNNEDTLINLALFMRYIMKEFRVRP